MSTQLESGPALFEQKNFYEFILNTICDGVFVTDRDDTITSINSTFSLTTGLTADMIVGKNILRHILTDSPQHFQQHYAQARRCLTPTHFDSIPATTIAGMPLLMSGWCIPKQARGVFEGMTCTFTDSRKQRQIQEKLFESETRFRSIAETATDGIITVNRSGEIMYWNAAATHIFGYGAREIVGKKMFQIIPDAIMHYHRTVFSKTEPGRIEASSGRSVEGTARHKDGTVFPVQLSVGSWAGGDEIYFTAIIRDITHTKVIEESLRHSEQALKNISDCLVNAHEQERKRIAGELHDGLGQILSAAKIGVKKMLSDGVDSRAGTTHEPTISLPHIIQSAIDEVRRISHNLRPSILDDLGIIAAINSLCLDFEKVNETITVKQRICARDEDIPDKIKIVIYRVLQEACTNIVRHSCADRVTVHLSSVSGALLLRIHDNGAGFDMQTLHARKESNRGLGVTSMQERIKFSGGHFTLTSSPGKGTTVRALWLPA